MANNPITSLRWRSTRRTERKLALAAKEPYARLHVQHRSTDCLQVTFDAEPYLPHWPAIVDLVVTTVFSTQPVCFIGYEPPYLDVDFAELSPRRALLRLNDVQYALAFADRVTPAQLLAATHTQDFKLKQLYIAAIPEQPRTRAEAFVAALAHTIAALDQALAKPLRANEINAVYAHADAELLRASTEEFICCDEDGEVLLWGHPNEGRLQRCIAALRSLAEQHGWQLDLNFTPKE